MQCENLRKETDVQLNKTFKTQVKINWRILIRIIWFSNVMKINRHIANLYVFFVNIFFSFNIIQIIYSKNISCNEKILEKKLTFHTNADDLQNQSET